jgi:hypothetical protein
MADEIVVRYDADVKKLETKLKGIEAEQLAIDKNAKATGQTITKEANKSAIAVQKVEKNTKSLKDAFRDLAGNLPFAGAVQQITMMGDSLNGVAQGAGKVSGSMKVLKAAILASGIGALAIGLLGIISYFKRTDEGATKLEGIMGSLSAATNVVTGYIAELGSELLEGVTSANSFGESLKNLGNVAGETFTKQASSINTIIEAHKDLFKGDFGKAFVKANDGVIQLTTGVENGTTKINAFADRVAKAAEEAYNFAIAMDSISDRQRDLNVELSENRVQIVELIKQSKNHSLSLSDRIKNLQEANALDAEGLDKTLALEKERLALLQQRNIREKDNLNQRLNERIASAKSEAEIIELKRKSLSVNDQLAQEEADQIIKINQLRAESIALQERNNTSIASLKEQAIQEELKREETKAIHLENIQKDRLLKGEINDEQFAKAQEHIVVESLKRQKVILQKYGKDVTEIDAAILNAMLKNREKHEEDTTQTILNELDNLAKIERNSNLQLLLDKKLTQDEFNKREAQDQIDLLEQKKTELERHGKDTVDIEKQILEAKLKLMKIEDDEKKKKDDEEKKRDEARKERIKAGLMEVIEITTQALGAINDRQLAKATAEINSEREAQDKITEDRLAAIDTRARAGVINETQAASQKAKIQRDAAKKESELKRKQFEAEQKASINRININTAEAIVKTLATYGFTPLAAIAIAGAIAVGEVQKATVRAQPVPKFEDGGKVLKGKSHRQGGILIEAEGGERIFSKEKTKQYEPLFKSIQEGYFDKYAETNFVKPALKREREKNRIKEEREKAAHEYMKSLTMNGLLDTSHLERLTKKNKSVRLENSKEIVNGIVDGLKSNSKRGL